jgi:hypothetical protein
MFAIGFDLCPRHPRLQGRALERFYGFHEVMMQLALKKAAR